MDVYEILYNLCLEYKVVLNDKEIPLWKLKKEDLKKANLDLPWNSIRDLAIYLYELKKKQQESKELVKCDNIVEILIGIALLRDDEYHCLVARDVCLDYLSAFITARINCIINHYYMLGRGKPQNTNIFDEVILKFPQKKNIRGENHNDLRDLIGKIRNYFK